MSPLGLDGLWGGHGSDWRHCCYSVEVQKTRVRVNGNELIAAKRAYEMAGKLCLRGSGEMVSVGVLGYADRSDLSNNKWYENRI